MTPITTSRRRWAVGAVVLALVAAGVGYRLGRPAGASGAGVPAAASAPTKVLYWYDPMVPDQHFDHPGKSSMGMEMIPKLADTGSGADSGVRIDPSAAQDIGVRLATVQRGSLASIVDATGVLDFNQRNVAIVQARAAGFVQRIYARAPGDVVPAGAPIADIFVPSWGGGQAEFLAVRRLGDPALTSAARERLKLLGMPAAEIAGVARSGRERSVVTVSTPVGGAIQTLDVRQGMTVSAGQTLAQVTSLSTVWLNAALPEAQTGLVQVGETARVELAAFPGQTFTGRVTTILPTAQADSRTLQVRVELPNPGGRLRPGMFATVHLGGSAQSALLVPSEAVIRTGRRDMVMLAAAKGRYQPVDVRIGREANGQTEILAGLSEGQQVVASGQYLLDSEASLSGIGARPLPTAPPSSPTTTLPLLQTRGRIEAISASDVTLSHEAVPAIGWPPMTMTFKFAAPTLGTGYKVGDRVAFGFQQRVAGPTIVQMTPEAPR